MRIIFFLLFTSTILAQEGDFLIRRNTASTVDIPDSGVRQDITYNQGVDSSGTTITYNPANGEWNLSETGKYLVFYSDQWGTTNTTDNRRQNAVYVIDSAGTEIDKGRSSGYLRKRNSMQECINTGFAILDITVANTKIHPKAYRVDNITGSTFRPSRISAESGMMVLKLDDSWNYGSYEVTSDKLITKTEGAHTEVEFQKTIEEDSPFSLQANDQDIDIASNNLILGVASIILEGSGTANSRTDLYGRYNIGGVSNRVSWTYIRNNSESCDDGCLSSAYIWDHTSGDDLELDVYLNETGTIGGTNTYIKSGSNLQLIELPSSAKFIVVEATSGNHNLNSDFVFDTEEHIDANEFTTSQPSSIIEVDSADSYLAFAGTFVTSDVASLRLNPGAEFRVNGQSTATNHMGASAYHRGSGTNCKGGLNIATLLPNLSAGDEVEMYTSILGSAGTTNIGEAYFTMIKLGSLFSGGGTSGWTGEINGIVNPAEINGVVPDEVNGI